MGIEKIIKQRRELITNEISRILNSRFKMYGDRFPELKGVFDQILKMAKNGKRIRGLLVLSGYYLGGENNEAIVKVAAAMELMHLGILIQDDVIDNADFRRGVETIQKLNIENLKKHDLKGVAISMGILLQQMALNIITEVPFKKTYLLKSINLLTSTVEKTACGEGVELFIDKKENPSEEEILNVLTNKTALYTISTPLLVGLQLAGGRRQVKKIIKRSGLYMGLTFQIVDDLLGVFANSEKVGKPVKDIWERKETLLTVYMRQKLSEEELAKLNHIYKEKDVLEDDDINWVKEKMISTGVVEEAKLKIDEYYKNALNLLAQINTSFKDVNDQEIEIIRAIFKAVKQKVDSVSMV